MSKGRIEENLWRNIYSCLNIQLTDSVLEAMDKTEQITALVLLDLSKAFDSIDHARLLSHKLSIVGASPSTVNWFKSYLFSRYQYVRIFPPTRMLCQSPMVSLKERFCHHFRFAFIWMTYPWHLALVTWNHTLTIPSYSCLPPDRAGLGHWKAGTRSCQGSPIVLWEPLTHKPR